MRRRVAAKILRLSRYRFEKYGYDRHHRAWLIGRRLKLFVIPKGAWICP